MRHTVLALVALLPAPALAGFECTVTRQCGGGTCEAYAGGPFVLEEAGDIWKVSTGGQTWDGYVTTTADTGGELSIVIPPQNGMSGLVTVFPAGEFLFTAHAIGPVAITGEGACVATGG